MGSRTRLAAALATACIAGLALPALASAGCSGSSTWAAAQSETRLEGTVLCLINERRAAAGLRSVAPNNKLRAAGLRHSTEMVRAGYFGHTSLSGISFVDRILDTGYTRRVRNWVIGENLVWGSGELSSPAALVRSWMNSPPHRANLLKPRFREVGIAAVRGTPQQRGDSAGITVSSEYGFRAKKKGKCKRLKRKLRAGKGGAKLRKKLRRKCKAGKARKRSRRR